MKTIKPLNRKNDLVVQELPGEILIYDLKTNKAVCLNETSALIWEACDGTKSVDELSRLITKRLKSPVNEDFIWLALEQFKRENLLADADTIVPDFGGLSRREVIRKVGFATMVALPLISAVIAPNSANAVSGIVCVNPPNGCACDPGTGVGNICFTRANPNAVTRCTLGCGCRTNTCGTGSCLGTCIVPPATV